MLPVDGVLARDENSLEFRWKSIKTIYSMTFLLFGSVESILGTRRLLRLGFNIKFAEGLLFFISAMIRAFLIFHLAKNWKTIIAKWRKCEDAFLKPPYRVRGWSLSLRIKVIFIVLAMLAIGDNITFCLFNILSFRTFSISSRTHFLLGHGNKRQSSSAHGMLTEIYDFLEELLGPLSTTSAASLSIQPV